VILLVGGTTVNLWGASSPGSASDPLITESYLRQQLELERSNWQNLEERLSRIEQQLQSGALTFSPPDPTTPTLHEGSTIFQALASLAERVSALESKLVSSTPAAVPGEQPVWEVVSLAAGEAVYASAGSEIILRAGFMQILAGEIGGVADLTAGRDLAHGAEVASNHLLLVPRDDGRGVLAVTDAVFLLYGTIRYR